MFGLTGFTVRSSISTGHNLREKRRGSITRPRGLERQPAGPSTSEVASRSSDEREITESPSTGVSEIHAEAFDEELSERQVLDARQTELKQWRAAEILKVSSTDPRNAVHHPLLFCHVDHDQLPAGHLYCRFTQCPMDGQRHLCFRGCRCVVDTQTNPHSMPLPKCYVRSEFLGGLTTEATVRSFDCLITEDAALPRSVILTIVGLSVPVSVWCIYFVIWWLFKSLYANSFSYLIQRSLLSLNVVSYVAYIGVTKTVINILNCIKVHDSTVFLQDSITYYWAVDTSQECLSGSHAVLAGVAGFPILILFTVSFPLVSAAILLTRRSRTSLLNKWLFATAGFMYRSYNPKFIFWESIIMLRKALLAIVVVFAYPLGGNLQGVLSSCVLIIALYVQAYCRPYRKEFKELNFYEGLSLLVSTLTFVAGLFFNDTRTSNTSRILLTVIVFLFNVAFLLFLVITFGRSCMDVLKRILAAKEPHVSDPSNLRGLLMAHARARISRVQTFIERLSRINSMKEDVKEEREIELV